MKRPVLYLCTVLVLALSCKKDKDDGPLPMKDTPASFRGLTATINGSTVTATTNLKVTRGNGDPSLGILPYIKITGYLDKKRIEVEVRWEPGTTPQTGEYPLTFDTENVHYYAHVIFDENVDAPTSQGTFFSSSSVDNSNQRGMINVVVLDAHTFVGSFSANTKSITDDKREIINGQFGGTY